MKIHGARLQRYELPLRHAWTTATARSTRRIGHLLGLRGESHVVWGDACTLPDGTAGEAARCGREIANLAARAWGEHGIEPPLPDAPHSAVRHAWTQAILSLEAESQGQPLAHALAKRLGTHARSSVPVNATLPHAPTVETVAAAQRAIAAGYACLKIKVDGSRKEPQRIAAVRDAVGPSVAIRIDANGSWDEADAPHLLQLYEPLGIEYVEQPLPPARLPDLQRLHGASKIPIAADESAHHPAQALALIERKAVDVLVLKPMALGGLDHALSLIESARDHGLVTIVTDSLESAIGRTGALHLAAALPGPERACGLASGEWFERDVVPDPPRVRAGRLQVPTEPGLGLRIDVDVEGRV